MDFNWCFDFSAAGANSAWILPNRIVEGGLFHCPAPLALEGTETAAWVAANRCGETFGEDLYMQLHALLFSLTSGKWQAMTAAWAAAPDPLVTEADYITLSTGIQELAGAP